MRSFRPAPRPDSEEWAMCCHGKVGSHGARHAVAVAIGTMLVVIDGVTSILGCGS